MGFETLVTVTDRLAKAAISVVKTRVNTFELNVAVLQPAGLLEHPRPVFPGKPESVMMRQPPLGMATCGLSDMTMVTLVALLKAPGLLSVMFGLLDPRLPRSIAGTTPVEDAPIWLAASIVALRYVAAARFVICP